MFDRKELFYSYKLGSICGTFGALQKGFIDQDEFIKQVGEIVEEVIAAEKNHDDITIKNSNN